MTRRTCVTSMPSASAISATDADGRKCFILAVAVFANKPIIQWCELCLRNVAEGMNLRVVGLTHTFKVFDSNFELGWVNGLSHAICSGWVLILHFF